MLTRNKARYAVMARDEFTTDISEHSDLKPSQYWDRRARGLGATFARPAVSCGEENLLGLPGDPYAKENILIHEFAHALHQMALIQLDNSFQNQIDECFKNSIDHNIWEGTYASTNVNEYWADGVQSWFNTNRENDRDHAWINTREELKKADPQLANLIEKTLGNSKWRYQLPHNRNPQTPHLNGFQSNNETPFSWPKDLVQWFEDYKSGKIGLAPKGSPNIKPVSIDSKSVQKSQYSRKRTQLYFRNLSDKTIFLECIDFQGMSKQRRTIRSQDQLEINSFVGHIWQVIDKVSGQKIIRFILPESKTSQFSLKGF
jgi:hypothetical protein